VLNLNTLKDRLQKAIDNINKETKKDNFKLWILLFASIANATLSLFDVPIIITSLMFVIIPVISFKIMTRINEYKVFQEKLISLLKGLEQNNKKNL
jgi:hypothetical protein